MHDLIGHVATGYGFDRGGEYSAWLVQRTLYTGLARWAAATELHGEISAHPYSATVGLRVEPGPADSGLEFRLDVNPRLLPLYIYKTAASFSHAMTQYIALALDQGLHGWRVTDCIVTMNKCGHYIGDGPAKRQLPTPRTTAADFRKLTPLVLMRALGQARHGRLRAHGQRPRRGPGGQNRRRASLPGQARRRRGHAAAAR